MEKSPVLPAEGKLHFECLYCPAVYPDLKGLVRHFEEKHRRGEYIVMEPPEWLLAAAE